MSASKRARGTDDSDFESDDDAPITLMSMSVPTPTIEQLLQEAEWMQAWTGTDKVLAGLTAFCSRQGLQCVARVRSSDKTRVTIACKHQATGCPLRLTAKKPEGYTKTVHPNIRSFVLGTCGTTTSVPPPPPVPPPPTVVTVSDPPKPPALSTTSTIPVHSPAMCVECPGPPDYPESPAVISCASIQHHWCSDCVNILAVSQLGDRDLFLSRRCKFLCPYDGTEIDCQRVLGTVTANTFSACVEALTEQAVVDTQKQMELQAKVTCNLHAGIPVFYFSLQAPGIPGTPHERAMLRIRHLAIPRCFTCDAIIPDFEACSALTCGRRAKVGDRTDLVGGCGANICAWCLTVIPAHESSHQHVIECKENPNLGMVYPPQPHPACWNAYMRMKARERWFNFVETIHGQENRDAVYNAVRDEFPDFDLSAEWLESRLRWLALCLDCGTDTVNIQLVVACHAVFLEMGYADDDVLRRAILFCDCVIPDILGAMRHANEHV